jgi:hypothetical protein
MQRLSGPTSGNYLCMTALLVLLLVLALFGVGFAWKALWIIAVVALVLWIVGFFARGTDARWYRW